jgi:hypothetical protein
VTTRRTITIAFNISSNLVTLAKRYRAGGKQNTEPVTYARSENCGIFLHLESLSHTPSTLTKRVGSN